jgi:hypothetical protein
MPRLRQACHPQELLPHQSVLITGLHLRLEAVPYVCLYYVNGAEISSLTRSSVLIAFTSSVPIGPGDDSTNSELERKKFFVTKKVFPSAAKAAVGHWFSFFLRTFYYHMLLHYTYNSLVTGNYHSMKSTKLTGLDCSKY